LIIHNNEETVLDFQTRFCLLFSLRPEVCLNKALLSYFHHFHFMVRELSVCAQFLALLLSILFLCSLEAETCQKNGALGQFGALLILLSVPCRWGREFSPGLRRQHVSHHSMLQVFWFALSLLPSFFLLNFFLQEATLTASLCAREFNCQPRDWGYVITYGVSFDPTML
jgi:hypothetical protein